MRRFMSFILVLVITLSMLTVSVNAASTNASDRAKEVTVNNKVKNANKDVNNAIGKATKKDGDRFGVDWLINETDNIINKAKNYAASCGILIGCDKDIPVQVDEIDLLIDPLFVINYGD